MYRLATSLGLVIRSPLRQSESRPVYFLLAVLQIGPSISTAVCADLNDVVRSYTED